MLEPETKLLQGRYQLVNKLFAEQAQDCEVWEALANPGQNDESPCLIRVWPFTPGPQENGRTGRPPTLLLTLWSRELRHQLRLASLAGADQSLVVLTDAGVDEDEHCFVTVHRADGQQPKRLSQLLTRRQRLGWLSGWKKLPTRAALWRGLLRIADGLDLLHSQQMLHRNLTEQSVLADEEEGPESFRLSGFEWTVRLGDRNLETLSVRPPELDHSNTSRATDWFLYGVLCTKILIGSPPIPGERPLAALLERLRSDKDLYDVERNFLERLIDPSPQGRISRSDQVHHEINAILTRLEEPQRQRNTDHFALIVDLGPTSKLHREIRDRLEQEELERRIEEQQAANLAVAATEPEARPKLAPSSQREWIESDLKQATLVRSTGSNVRVLRGRKLHYRISEHTPYGQNPQGNWDLAFTSQTWDIRGAGFHEDLEIELPVPVRVFVPDDVRRDRAKIVDRARSWKPFTSRKVEAVAQAATERLFVEYLALTNQIVALTHDAQIFGYKIEDQFLKDATDYIAVRQMKRDEDPPKWALRVRTSLARQGLSPLRQMVEDMRNEEARVQPDDPRPRLLLTSSDRLRLLDKVVEKELWEVIDSEEFDKARPPSKAQLDADPDPTLVFLRRGRAKDVLPPEPIGFLRPSDHWRNTLLVARRQKAIEALPQHSYLLRALLTPDDARINAKLSKLPIQPDEGVKESERLDDAKKLALHNIWTTRPVFTLQGPPGTGKTTLVTALLRQIFAEDKNAQVLVTAQAHSAVDTLRERVTRAYKDVPEAQRPLAIRLKIKGSSSDLQRDETDYPEQVAQRLLRRSYEELSALTERSATQDAWLTVAEKLRHMDGGSSTDPDAGPFKELLRRAANITYCTSTAGDLAVLATRTQSFDWCIVEEAAKAHGFDLVLPLQLGYRWLLIGDHYQLRPHRYRDFQDALADLPDVMQRLKHLMDRGNRLIDRDLVQRWFQHDSQDGTLTTEQDKLRMTCTDWLRFFERLFKDCEDVSTKNPERATEQAAPLAQMLDQQHRMHPVIADLVSKAFYESQSPPRPIRSMTNSALGPIARVRHAFVAPAGIEDKAIVWVDVPRLHTEPGKTGTDEGFWSSAKEAEAIERFLLSLRVDPQREAALYQSEENPEDLKRFKLAVLSPYRKQVFSAPLRDAVRRVYQRKPPWLRSGELFQQRPRTVDGYQGNEAAIVVVSLVRNNTNEQDPAIALGFLQELERINVMFSRAERLLVLVGCWDFFQSVAASLAQGGSLQEWPVIMKYLAEAVEDKTALRIKMEDLPPLAQRELRS